MSLFIVSMSTTQGPYGPTVNMSYHRNEDDARGSFQECLDSVGEDPSTILLVRVDESTMTETILDSFEGTEEDLGYDEMEVG
jgi:hypothetical protein